MLIGILTLILISNAITATQEKAILYPRTMILAVTYILYMTYNGLHINALNQGVSIYNGLFSTTTISQAFNLFIFLLAGMTAMLTAFYPRDYKGSTLLVNSYEKISTFCNINININLKQFHIIEYTLITIFIISGAVFLMSSSDLMSLFLSIELQSYGLYILATLYRDSESSTSSALTYFLLGGLSSCFILLGSAILYINSGNTNLDNIFIINNISEISTNVKNIFDINNNLFFNNYYMENYLNLSLIVLTVGLLFKISAAPFHFWSPDVYDGIPTVVTTFVAIIAKISIFVLLLELVSSTNLEDLTMYDNANISHMDTSYLNNGWINILTYSSLLSIIIGSLLGLTQYRIKRLFAYSTISHVGFILLALSINKIESIQGYIFYILQYSFSNLNTFLMLILIGYSLYNWNSGHNYFRLIDGKNSPIQLLSQLKGYFYINSFLAISFTITLFSFVGIPPLIGFFAKQMVLSAALDKGFIFMTLVGVISSVIGAAYYLNIVKLIFFNKSEYEFKLYNVKHATLHSEQDEYTNISNNTVINDYLVALVSILTMLITLFIFVPGEWFRVVSMLSLSLPNI